MGVTNEELVERILFTEGGVQNDPADTDGPLSTNWGITAATLTAYWGRMVTEEDMRNLSREEAKEIYLQLFVIRPGFHRVQDELLRYQLVDFGVHSHPRTAIRFLQQVLGVEVDGMLGPVTLKALDAANPVDVSNALMAKRVQFMADQIAADQRPQPLNKQRFLRGWIQRALSFLRRSEPSSPSPT